MVGAEKNLIRSFEAKAIPRSVIQVGHDALDILLGQCPAIRSFRQIWADQAVALFIQASLPWGSVVRKESRGLQLFRSIGMESKLFAVFIGQRIHLVGQSLKRS